MVKTTLGSKQDLKVVFCLITRWAISVDCQLWAAAFRAYLISHKSIIPYPGGFVKMVSNNDTILMLQVFDSKGKLYLHETITRDLFTTP